MMSTKTLPTDEPVWFATLSPLSSLDLGEVEVLAGHDLRGLADIFDLGDRDEAALVVADDERLRRIGAQVHLPRHHLLHGEIARRHGEFLELDAALLEQTRFEQIVGRHAPDVGLEALAHGLERGCRSHAAEACRHQSGARREILPSCQVNAPVPHRMSSVMFVAIGVCRRLVLIDRVPSVPIPKFASLCGALACELRNQRDTSNL